MKWREDRVGSYRLCGEQSEIRTGKHRIRKIPNTWVDKGNHNITRKQCCLCNISVISIRGKTC